MAKKNDDTAQLRAAVALLTDGVAHLIAAFRVANTQDVSRFEVGRSIARSARSVDLARKQLDGAE